MSPGPVQSSCNPRWDSPVGHWNRRREWGSVLHDSLSHYSQRKRSQKVPLHLQERRQGNIPVKDVWEELYNKGTCNVRGRSYKDYNYRLDIIRMLNTTQKVGQGDHPVL